jgi:hypothetical protein
MLGGLTGGLAGTLAYLLGRGRDGNSKNSLGSI